MIGPIVWYSSVRLTKIGVLAVLFVSDHWQGSGLFGEKVIFWWYRNDTSPLRVTKVVQNNMFRNSKEAVWYYIDLSGQSCCVHTFKVSMKGNIGKDTGCVSTCKSFSDSHWLVKGINLSNAIWMDWYPLPLLHASSQIQGFLAL